VPSPLPPFLAAATEEELNAAARPVYPFSAIIGQEEMKFAAIMNIIDPNIGGIMVMGDRGTGKSTTVRALVS
jgi:magnesium chelatase subunit I